MKKKLVTTMILAAAVMLHCIPVCAQEYTTDGTADCRVSATVESSYSVQVPALLELDYNSSSGKYEGDYQVSAKGNIQPDKSVTIQPTESSFTLTGTLSGETSQASISQEVTEWVHSSRQADGTGKVHISVEEYTQAQGSVSAELTQADSYTGEITFAFCLGDCTE